MATTIIEKGLIASGIVVAIIAATSKCTGPEENTTQPATETSQLEQNTYQPASTVEYKPRSPKLLTSTSKTLLGSGHAFGLGVSYVVDRYEVTNDGYRIAVVKSLLVGEEEVEIWTEGERVLNLNKGDKFMYVKTFADDADSTVTFVMLDPDTP